MSTKKVRDLTPATNIRATDMLLVSLASPEVDRKLTFGSLLSSMGIRSFLFSALPGGYSNGLIYVTDGRKIGEGGGLGTGVVCSWNGSNWIAVDSGSAVAN